MCDWTSNKMIKFLERNLEQSIKTVGLNIFLTIVPLNLLASTLHGHPAHGLGHRIALSLYHGELGWLVTNVLEHDRVLCRSTIKCWNLNCYFSFLQSTILPSYIMTIIIASPDLFSFSIDLPFCFLVTLTQTGICFSSVIVLISPWMQFQGRYSLTMISSSLTSSSTGYS